MKRIHELSLTQVKKLFLALLMLVSVPLFLRADPPKSLTVTYNNETMKLKVIAVHPVKNVQEHYIDQIAILVNGKEAKIIKLQKQSDSKNETIEVSVPEIVKGSKVTVKARCNEFGSKSKSISIK